MTALTTKRGAAPQQPESEMYKAPKAILNHPGVKACEDGYAQGCSHKHSVLLLPGWDFTGRDLAGGGCGFFDSYREFMEYKPCKVRN